MTITDLFKDLIETSKERLKTPVSGAFVFSFIVWNWRAIAILLFSNATIEDRIVVVNYFYCNASSILCPVLLALAYTIGIPKLTLEIDKLLSTTKSARITKIYSDKRLILSEKLKLAKTERELKDIESGNKEIQDHLDEIQSLKDQIETQKETIKHINETNKNTIDELNHSLKEANSRNSSSFDDLDIVNFQNLRAIVFGDTLNLDQEISNKVLKACESITFGEFKVLKKVHIDKGSYVYFKHGEFSDNILKSLVDKNILKFSEEKTSENMQVTTTEIGAILLDIIQSL